MVTAEFGGEDFHLVDKILADVANDIVEQIQHEIDVDDLVFTGQLKNSWETHKLPDGSILVGSRLIWAAVMNEGRIPGKMPPVNALFPWVFQKIGGKNEEEIKRIAFLIARKIAEKGIEPRNYVARALFTMEKQTQ